MKEESKNYINKSCLIGYPYYFEGIIKCIYTKNEAYHWVNSEFVKKPITINYEEESMKLKGEYLTKYGIDIIDSRFQNSNVPYLFEVTPLKGMTISEGMKKKYWGYVPILIPYQLVLKDPKYINHFLQDERWVEKKMELLDKFPIGSNVVLIRYPNYFGSTGVIIQSDTNQTLKVQLKTTLSPNSVYHSGIDFFSLTKQNYIASSDIAKKLGIQNLTLSRITGTLEVKVNHVLVDLGLGLKYSRQELLVLGYARRGISLKPKTPGEKAPSLPLPEKWSYSVEAENFIKSYKDAFPTLFDGVNQDPQKDIYEVNDLFPLPPTSDSKPSDEEIVRKVLEWLAANSPVLNLPLMPADSISLPTSIIHLIEEKTKQMAQYTSPVKTSNPITVSNKDLFLPVKSLSSFDLGDRVMYVKNNGKVPFGLTGTVVSLFNAQKLAEVVFDSEFLSATTLNGKCKTPKGATILYHHLFNMTQFRNTSPSTRSNNRKQSGSASKSSPSKNIYAHLEGSDNSDQ